jgi:hypothetical protein
MRQNSVAVMPEVIVRLTRKLKHEDGTAEAPQGSIRLETLDRTRHRQELRKYTNLELILSGRGDCEVAQLRSGAGMYSQQGFIGDQLCAG